MPPNNALNLPTAYAPPIRWMALFLFHPQVKLELWENFQRATIRNRCAIVTSQGVQQLTIPLQGGRHQGVIHEVRISYAEDWPKQHLKALRTAYSKSPFYEFLEYELQQVLTQQYEFLWECNAAVINMFLDWLQYRVPLPITSHYEGLQPVFQSKFFWEPNKIQQKLPYNQVFDESQPFVGNLSALDLFFNVGPEA
ncbi:MAG: WbqC family protein, partial [Schleiferiaceae bacterium]|nr:WbqC family protein [Schleiferiaceae bacterium]